VGLRHRREEKSERRARPERHDRDQAAANCDERDIARGHRRPDSFNYGHLNVLLEVLFVLLGRFLDPAAAGSIWRAVDATDRSVKSEQMGTDRSQSQEERSMARQAVKEPASRPAEGRTSMPAKEARERILAAVNELFYRDGVRAVGVDAVIEHAG